MYKKIEEKPKKSYDFYGRAAFKKIMQDQTPIPQIKPDPSFQITHIRLSKFNTPIQMVPVPAVPTVKKILLSSK